MDQIGANTPTLIKANLMTEQLSVQMHRPHSRQVSVPDLTVL